MVQGRCPVAYLVPAIVAYFVLVVERGVQTFARHTFCPIVRPYKFIALLISYYDVVAV